MNQYPYTNAYFRSTDPCPAMLDDFEIPAGWWSRRYEYAWAAQYAERRQIVADMGCGWHYRPFHDFLDNVCDFVYGVDGNIGVLNEVEIPPMKNGVFIVADFSRPVLQIPKESLDRIFCISVLEEVINYEDALREFGRLLKPDGRIILTCDMPYDSDVPEHELYKGVKLRDLEAAMRGVGLRYDGVINRVKEDNILYNAQFNLCVWHCVLRKE